MLYLIIMKILLNFFLLIFIVCCSRSSEITPAVESSSLRNVLKGKKFTVKYPLTDYDLGYYADEDILGSKPTNLIESFIYSIKKNVIEFAVHDLREGKAKIEMQLRLPLELLSLVNSVKLKRAFFMLDSCISKGCERRIEDKVSMGWFDNVYAGISHYPGYPILGELERTRPGYNEIKDDINDLFAGKSIKKRKNDFIHLARVETNKGRRRYFKNEFLLKGKISDLNNINDFLNKNKKRLNIISLAPLGNILFVETSDKGAAFKKASTFDGELRSILTTNYGVVTPKQCHTGMCVDFEINDTELKPFLDDKRNLNVHAAFDIAKVPKLDFKFKGFLEIELEFNDENLNF